MLLPEDYTIWNIRKSLIQSDIPLLIDELKVLNLILYYFPKTKMSWAHRDWVYHQLLPLLLSESIPTNKKPKFYLKESESIYLILIL